MGSESSTIVQRLWNDCNVLRFENLQAALEQFAGIYEELGAKGED